MSRISNNELSRRQFLEFLGYGASAAFIGTSILPGCTTTTKPVSSGRAGDLRLSELGFTPLTPSTADELQLVEGLRSQILIDWDKSLNDRGDRFGFNNDFIATIPIDPINPLDVIMLVNHEYPVPFFLTDNPSSTERSKEDIIRQQKAVGYSLIRVKKNTETGDWDFIANDPLNRRFDGTTKIPIVCTRAIGGSRDAIGTFANCAGGTTPWRTFLSCEENYDNYYGDWKYEGDGTRKKVFATTNYGWSQFFDRDPEHYGWVNEINPFTGVTRKLTSLGRFSHESATVVPLSDGRAVVYSGDDANDECLYKFVGSVPRSLEKGTLYVANFATRKWVALDWNKNPILKSNFKDQTEVLIRTREAAHLVGGTRLDRPEDIERDPRTGAMLVALTNNKAKGNFHGSILKISERGNDPSSLDFEYSTFLTGGPTSGVTCPDNMAFDPRGNLWIAVDVSARELDQPHYKNFGNNALFFVPMSGTHAGQPFQVATSPVDAEFTGPHFSADGRTLFLAVQHPGEFSTDMTKLRSHWPYGGDQLPRSAVVAISGPLLERWSAV